MKLQSPSLEVGKLTKLIKYYFKTGAEINLKLKIFKIFFLPADNVETPTEEEEPDPNAGRFIRYEFTPNFLKLKAIGST